MFNRFVTSIGLGETADKSSGSAGAPGPYANKEVNYIYNFLFCDDLALFRPRSGQSPTPWSALLFAETLDPPAIAALAADSQAESRVRVLAYNWLREHQQPVPKGDVLGVIVEVPLAGGPDVLAGFLDGSVRYINQSGKLAVFEGGPPNVEAKARELVAAGQLAVSKIGPWDMPRLAPPKLGRVRMTFLVSDGLYFGDGPFEVMMREPIAGPVVRIAIDLLQLVVEAAGR
jgi:hypothetical protein